MKLMRLLPLLLLIPVIILLQSCGGGGTSDTAGSLTIGTPTSTDNSDGTYSVTASVTYTPPSGKSAQGVVITTTVSDSYGASLSQNATLTSGSNTVTYTFLVNRRSTSNRISIVAAIGGMTASVGITIPAYVPPLVVLPISVAFVETDLADTVKTVAVSGGTSPYAVSSSVPADIIATISGGILSIKLVNAAAIIPGTSSTATITVNDSSVTPLTKTIDVTYFK